MLRQKTLKIGSRLGALFLLCVYLIGCNSTKKSEALTGLRMALNSINPNGESGDSVAPLDTFIHLTIYDEMTDMEAIKEKYAAEFAYFQNQITFYHRLFDRHHGYLDESQQLINNLYVINSNYGSGKRLEIDPELHAILESALALNRLTEGYFNIAVATASDFWRSQIGDDYFESPPPQEAEVKALKQCIPTADELSEILDLSTSEGKYYVEFKELKKCTTNLTYYDYELEAEMPLNRVALTLGGLAKGYAVERIMEHFGPNVRAVINAGNSSVAMNFDYPPAVTINITNGNSETIATYKADKPIAISTSGILRDGYVPTQAEKTLWHDKIDPLTGRPANYHGYVNVFGRNAFFLEALSTALLVSTKENGVALFKKLEKETFEGEIIGDLSVIYHTNYDLNNPNYKKQYDLYIYNIDRAQFELVLTPEVSGNLKYYYNDAKWGQNLWLEYIRQEALTLGLVAGIILLLAGGLVYGWWRRRKISANA